jgi:hypothetical protein
LATSPPIGEALATSALDRAAGALGIVDPELDANREIAFDGVGREGRALRFANAPKSLLISARVYGPGCQSNWLISLGGANPSSSRRESRANLGIKTGGAKAATAAPRAARTRALYSRKNSGGIRPPAGSTSLVHYSEFSARRLGLNTPFRSFAQQHTTINDGCQYLYKPTLARAAAMQFLGSGCACYDPR